MQRRTNPRPLRYRQRIQSSREVLVEKGGTQPNLSVIEDCLKTLRANASVPIDNIPDGDVSTCWKQVTTAMGLMENSSFYDTLADMIRKEFSDLSTPIPDTIGGYFAGCLVDPSKLPVPVSCTPTCINAAAPSSSYMQQHGITPCPFATVMASMVNGGYNFTILNNEPTAEGIVYVNQPTFNGFTTAEKDQLHKLLPNLTTISVISTANNTYTTLLSNSPISSIATRNTSIWEGIPTASNPAINSPNISWILIAIIVIIIIILIVWWYRSQQ